MLSYLIKIFKRIFLPCCNAPPDPPKQKDILVQSHDFVQLRPCKNFVDRSPEIATFWTNNTVYLVTAPRRWGKSTKLSTMKYSFEIQVNPGNATAVKKTALSSRKIVTDTRHYGFFKEFRISESPATLEHFG